MGGELMALPLYLTLRETEVLAVAVGFLLYFDDAVRAMPDEVKARLGEREGLAGIARADRTQAAMRERLPVLLSLATALAEHGETLRRTDDP